MNAVPPSFAPMADAAPPVARADAVGLRWSALAAAANVVAALAGIDPEPASAEVRDFPALIRAAEAWRREQAENGIADLAAVMEPGIAALLSIHARGSDSRPAATALWREFVAARGAIFALLPAGGHRGPLRTA
jgi:hypothetical protein